MGGEGLYRSDSLDVGAEDDVPAVAYELVHVGPGDAVPVVVDAGVFEESTFGDQLLEAFGGDEVVVDAFDLAGSRGAGGDGGYLAHAGLGFEELVD